MDSNILIPYTILQKEVSIFSLHLLQTEIKSWPGIGRAKVF